MLEKIKNETGCLTNRKIKYTKLSATFQMYVANQTDPSNVLLRDMVTDLLNKPERGKGLASGEDCGKITN